MKSRIKVSLKPVPKELVIGVLASLAILCGNHVLAQGYAPAILEEIIVTAQKREQSILDIPSTVNAIGGDALADLGIHDFNDIEQLTAGLTLDASGRNKTVSLRGVSYDPDSGAQPVVDLYWNEMNVRPDVLFQQMYDLQRIEVLRGPQGVLQGRTSPAGSITAFTRRPVMDELEGEVLVTTDDNAGINSQAAISIPLLENELALRLAGVYDQSDAAGVKNLTTGQDQEEKTKSVRATLDWQPGEAFSNTLVVEYLDRDLDLMRPVEGYDLSGDRPTLGTYDRKLFSDGEAKQENENTLAVYKLDWDVGNQLISLVAGYQDKTQRTQEDADVANLVPGFAANGIATTDTTTYSQELRLSSVEATNWEYMFGLYHLDTETHTVSDRNNSAVIDVLIDIPIEVEEYAVFTNNVIELQENLYLHVGARYSEIRQDLRTDLTVIVNGVPTPVTPLVSEKNSRSDSDSLTGSLKLRYDMTDDMMVYFGYDRGYRPGGISIVGEALDEETLLYEEETSNSLEAGFKTSILEDRVQLRGSVFYQEYEDYISRRVRLAVDADRDGSVDTRPTAGLTFNEDATIRGAELEASGLIGDNWRWGGGLSYVDAKYDDDSTAPCNQFDAAVNPTIPEGQQVAICDVSNLHISEEPNWSASLNSEYTVPLENMDWFLRGLYKYSGERVNEDLGKIDDYSIFNLYTGLRSSNGAWEVSIWGKNLFDEEAQTGLLPPEITPDTMSYNIVKIIQPRIVGASLVFRLGGL